MVASPVASAEGVVSGSAVEAVMADHTETDRGFQDIVAATADGEVVAFPVNPKPIVPGTPFEVVGSVTTATAEEVVVSTTAASIVSEPR